MQNNKKTESMYWKGGIGTRLQSNENTNLFQIHEVRKKIEQGNS